MSAKVTIIGGGSASFGSQMIADAIRTPQLKNGTIFLYDIDIAKLKMVRKLAEMMAKKTNSTLKIHHTTDLEEALEAADFVILSHSQDKYKLWRQDYLIPLEKFGLRQSSGENGGPGSIFHTCRQVPILINMCNFMEDVCPEALLMIFSEPESRLADVVHRFTKVRAVGLCHGSMWNVAAIGRFLGVAGDKTSFATGQTTDSGLTFKHGGINHLTWLTELKFKSDGSDAYPVFAEKLKQVEKMRVPTEEEILSNFPPGGIESRGYGPLVQPLCRKLFDIYGLYPSPADHLIAEHLNFGLEICLDHLTGLRWIESVEEIGKFVYSLVMDAINGKPEAVKEILTKGSGKIAFDIIADILEDRDRVEPTLNIPNDGYIKNLPQGAIVEIPARINKRKIEGVSVELSNGMANLCNIELKVRELLSEAAVTGERTLLLQSLLADQLVKDIETAEALIHVFLEKQSKYLPQFTNKNDHLLLASTRNKYS